MSEVTLPSQDLAIHLPLTILIHHPIKHAVYERIDTVTETFAYALRAGRSAILVNEAIFFDFLFRNINYNSDHKKGYHYFSQDFTFDSALWNVYTFKDMNFFSGSRQLLLFIPKNRTKTFFGYGFKEEECETFDVLPLLEKKTSIKRSLDRLFLQVSTKSKATLVDDLKRLFQHQSPENAQWDIFWAGHGTHGKQGKIGGLLVPEAEDLLVFFNKHLSMNMLVLDSCYSGGEYLKTLSLRDIMDKPRFFAPLHYIIIALSSGDLPTSLYFQTEQGRQFFKTLFDEMQQLGLNNRYRLEDFIKITSPFLGPDNVDYRNIPQIILPGGIAIQSFVPDKTVMVLGKARVRSAEIEKQAIRLYPQTKEDGFDFPLHVLLYPHVVKTPLYIKAAKLDPSVGDPKLFPKLWEELPSYIDLLVRYRKKFAEGSQERLLIKNREHGEYLYPNIISMHHGDTMQYIEKIVFEGDGSQGAEGILKGIRDAFSNIQQRPTRKIFYIDSLEGANDIGPLLKMMQRVHVLKDEHRLIQELPQDWNLLKLENVLILTEYNKEKGIAFEIHFTINNNGKKTLWEFLGEQFIMEEAGIPAWGGFTQNKDIDLYITAYAKNKAQILQHEESTFVSVPQPIKSLSSIAESQKITITVAVQTVEGVKEFVVPLMISSTSIKVADLIDMVQQYLRTTHKIVPLYGSSSSQAPLTTAANFDSQHVSTSATSSSDVVRSIDVPMNTLMMNGIRKKLNDYLTVDQALLQATIQLYMGILPRTE